MLARRLAGFVLLLLPVFNGADGQGLTCRNSSRDTVDWCAIAYLLTSPLHLLRSTLRSITLHKCSSTFNASSGPAKKRLCAKLSRWVVIKLPFGKEYLFLDSGQAALGETLHMKCMHAALDTLVAEEPSKLGVCMTIVYSEDSASTHATGHLKWQYHGDIAGLRLNPLAETLQQARSAPCYSPLAHLSGLAQLHSK